MSDKRIRRIILEVAGIVLIAILLAVGRDQSKKGSIYLKNLTIQSGTGSFDTRWLHEMLWKETGQKSDGTEEGGTGTLKYSFAAWTQCQKESLRSESGGKNCTADVIAVYGPSHCVFPIGSNIPASDSKGCILGKKLSEELFGSTHAEGEKLIWQEHEWIVREILDEPSEICILQAADRTEELTFDKISIAMAPEEDRRQTGDEFILQQGLDAYALRFDQLYGMGWLLEMIPTNWSDFDGWKHNFEEHSKAVQYVKKAERTVIEETGLEYQKRGRIFIILGILLSIIGIGVMWRYYTVTMHK